MTSCAIGTAQAWLETHKDFSGDECLIWPFKRDRDGYAHTKHDGRDVRVPRLVCTDRHGPPPTPEHQAAHSCGKGHLGCVNGSHLGWKTASENQADRLIHGTHNRGERHNMAKLTEADVLAIRATSGVPQTKLAEQYGVSSTAISDIIRRKKWAWL